MDSFSYILIVDDTPEHIHTAGAILSGKGYRLKAAADGEQALAVIRKAPPALILLDISLGGRLDGFDICRMVKADPKLAPTAIIFVTADHNRATLQKGFDLGAQDYIMKPYNASELIARVDSHFKIAAQAAELRNAYQELDQFCHNISHDLKAPLQVITQLTAALQEELSLASVPLPEAADMILSAMMSKCSSTLIMINRLLEFSKISGAALQYESIDCNLLIADIIEDIRLLSPERNIKFSCGTLPAIDGDPTLIRQLFQNILSNSVKFTRTRNPAVIDISGHISENGRHIDITDNGVGFDIGNSDKLFHVFCRFHDDSVYEGTGVGLALCHKIITRHGGSVTIESEPEKGTHVALKFRHPTVNC